MISDVFLDVVNEGIIGELYVFLYICFMIYGFHNIYVSIIEYGYENQRK